MTEFVFLFLDAVEIRDSTEADQHAMLAAYAAFMAPLEAAGRVKEAGGLGPDFDCARVVRRPDGRVEVTEGPFAAAGGVVGGYLVVDCESLDDAIALAATCPAAGRAPIEVRQVWRH
jgi:hypothetical protein